jgi:hypothetical protein
VNHHWNFRWCRKLWICTAWDNRHRLSGLAVRIARLCNRQVDEHRWDPGVWKFLGNYNVGKWRRTLVYKTGLLGFWKTVPNTKGHRGFLSSNIATKVDCFPEWVLFCSKIHDFRILLGFKSKLSLVFLQCILEVLISKRGSETGYTYWKILWSCSDCFGKNSGGWACLKLYHSLFLPYPFQFITINHSIVQCLVAQATNSLFTLSGNKR